MPEKTSKLSGFYKLSLEERLKIVSEFAELTEEETDAISKQGLSLSQADLMIENVIGTMQIPLGVAANFLINGKDYIVPMALEEPSVVAAASNIAKLARIKGGFKAETTEPVMIGQIQLTGLLSDVAEAKEKILARKKELLELANAQDPMLVKFGGGARDLEIREVETPSEKMLVVHLLVDCRDAMGANAVNTMAETLAPVIEKETGGKVYLRIISNLAVHRLARASAVFDKDAMGGSDVVKGVVKAYEFSAADQFRATTYNKGIMNGIDAVVIATGNDFRATEAGAHSYASYGRKYTTLTKWWENEDGDLEGSIELPMAVGLVGGATKVHPTARACVKILGVKSASELAGIIVSVGMAQNLGALKALATEGIQRGHMGLHARNVAVMAGATGDMIDKVVKVMVSEKKVRLDRAKEVLEELQEK